MFIVANFSLCCLNLAQLKSVAGIGENLILMHHLLFLFLKFTEVSSLLQTHNFHLCISVVRVTYPKNLVLSP